MTVFYDSTQAWIMAKFVPTYLGAYSLVKGWKPLEGGGTWQPFFLRYRVKINMATGKTYLANPCGKWVCAYQGGRGLKQPDDE